MAADGHGGSRLRHAPHYGDYYPAGSRLDLEFRAIFLILQMGRSWSKSIERRLARETGQSRARWEALFAIAFADGPTTASEMAQLMGVKWPALVRLLEALEEDGMIQRRDNPADGRSRLITLTEAGQTVIRNVRATVDPARAEALQHMSDAELQATIALVERMLETTLPD